MGATEHALPLAGRKVLDLSMLTPGPFATQILADLGATVLKVERPPLGDLERVTMPNYFRAYNRGKRSIALDLRREADRGVFLRLVPETDVVVEGFRPGVVERLGVGFDDISPLQPNLVYVSLSGFGTTGPRTKERAHDPEFQALAGSLHFNRGSDGKPVYNTAGPVFDYAAGLYAVVAILAVLQDHDPHRAAVHLEVPCFAAGLALMFPRLVDAMESTRDIAGLDIIMAGNDGAWLTVAAPEDNTWDPLCRAIGRPDLAQRDELKTFDGRLRNADEINDAIRNAIATDSRDSWAQRLADAGVPCAPILVPREVFDDAQVQHLGTILREPTFRARLPIQGLTSAMHADSPQLDEAGAAVRMAGWEGAA